MTTTRYQAWLDRYGDWYPDDVQRRRAFRDHEANLAVLAVLTEVSRELWP
jgi:hypothetical protein